MQMMKKGEWLEIVVPNEWDGRSIESLLKEVWQVPKKLLHQFRMDKSVKVGGEIHPWSRQIKEGERMLVKLFAEEEYGVDPTPLELNVIYEDDHVLVANKPAGMNTHPANEKQKDTLANAVAYHFMVNGVKTKVRHIHRLDQDTTGAVLFAKHALAGAILDRLLDARKIKRTYVALVHGKLREKRGVIDEPIGKDRHHPSRRRVSPTGQEAKTNYVVLNYDRSKDMSLVKLELETGRTHQIRVHMSHIGHPLIGDRLYGGKGANIPRQALHAAWLAFLHPISGEKITSTAPFLDKPPIFEGDVADFE